MSLAEAVKRPHVHEERQPFKLGLFHYALIFLITSFVGLAGETLVSFVLDGRWESRAGYVIGPLSPIYGLGAVLITLVVNPLRSRDIAIQFLAAGLVGGALEYTAGWLLETCCGIVAWSYIDQPLNFHGHTCVAMMVVWGVVGVAWSLTALPFVVGLIERIPESSRRAITLAAIAYIAVDSALTLACFDSWFCRTAGYPISSPLQQFCAQFFNDEFMRTRFETMSMWTSLASR